MSGTTLAPVFCFKSDFGTVFPLVCLDFVLPSFSLDSESLDSVFDISRFSLPSLEDSDEILLRFDGVAPAKN